MIAGWLTEYLGLQEGNYLILKTIAAYDGSVVPLEDVRLEEVNGES